MFLPLALALEPTELSLLASSWAAVSSDGTWAQQRPQPRLGRAAAQAVVLADRLYLLGGQTLDHKVGRR